MRDQNSSEGYQNLGKQLKALRSRANESLAEASGAVEIDARDLANYELGKNRPSEDVLLLLISHFGARDDEALRLWEMAGYGNDKIPIAHISNEEINLMTQNYQDNQRVLFTDTVDIMVNNHGVVMNFMQTTGPSSSPASVAKVGMSREHAKSVLQILHTTLEQTEASQLNKKSDSSK